jgi:hypothetical protein
MAMLGQLHNAVAAVCPIEGLSQSRTGEITIQFLDSATPEQRQAAQNIVDNWVEPPERRLVWALDFLDRFPEATQLAVVAAAQNNPVIRLWYDRLLANGSVDLDNPRLIVGLQTMRDAGLMTQEMIDNALQ